MELALERENKIAYLVSAFIVHIFGLINFSAVIPLRIYFDMIYCPQDPFMKFAYSFKYGSLLNASLQWTYNLLAVVVDLMLISSYTMDAPPKLLMLRSFIRSCLALPCAFYICSRFWILYWLKFKIRGIECYPRWCRHLLFTLNPFLLICDVVSCKGDSTGSFVALVAINILCSLYFIWIHIIYHFTGVWALDIIGDLSLLGKLVGYSIIALWLYISFFLGKIFNELLWNEDFVARIPYLRNCVSVPSRFVYGNPSLESTTFRLHLSRTESMFVDQPKKRQPNYENILTYFKK